MPSPDKIEGIKAGYDCYRFGNQDIYNLWSVIHYFDEGCQPQAYWLDTSSNDLAIEALHKEVLGYGIAFCQKQGEIAQRTWQR